MAIYIVFSNYFHRGVFGVYSSIKRARIAFENFIAEDMNIVSFVDLGEYFYEFTTKNGEVFHAEICFDVIDEEF